MLMLKKEGKIALIIVPGLYGQYPFHCSYCVQVITNNLLYVGVIFLLLGSYKSLALKEDDPSVD